ncbi:MAG: Gldg family protein [Anaerolineales bacterium]|nr:MAG: Gldg family protein [Anaerolineales bacterium]
MAGKKKNPYAKYAFIGLILALVACVVSGLLVSANALLAVGMFNLSPEQRDTLTLVLQISIGLLVIGLAAYAMMSPDTVRRFLTGRQARYGSNSLILTLAFIGVIFVANYIVFNNPKSWDWTEDKSNTLASETMDILSALPAKVTATAFYSSSLDRSTAEDLLIKFKTNSGGNFDYQFVNPDLDPIAAREAGITGDGKILLQMGEAKEIASFASETELARTMIRLISPESRTVYFLQGHGEAALSAGSERSFTIAKSTLESKNYVVDTLNLLSQSSIPKDADVIIVAGPQKPLTAQEVNLLKDFVAAGGSLIVMQDPIPFTEFGNAADPLANYLESDWGITLNDDFIFDFASQQPLNAISAGITPHPITQNLSINYAVIMPQARSISVTPSESMEIVATPLMFTSDNSWGETSYDETAEQYQYDEGVDNLGPLYLAAVGENTVTSGRVVVFGNSLFVIDGNFDVYGNGNMFINSVDWAAEQEDQLTLTTRPATQRTFVPPSQIVFIILVLVSVIVLPGMVIVSGISAWVARRKRG